MGKKYSKIADKLVQRLKSEGFIVQRYDAYSTSSVYLKLDFGLAYTVRISDHSGKSHLRYTYNLIKGYKGKNLIKQDGVWRQYYNFDQLEEMIARIISGREWVKQRYHPDYKADMERAQIENQGKRGFWESAVIV